MVAGNLEISAGTYSGCAALVNFTHAPGAKLASGPEPDRRLLRSRYASTQPLSARSITRFCSATCRRCDPVAGEPHDRNNLGVVGRIVRRVAAVVTRRGDNHHSPVNGISDGFVHERRDVRVSKGQIQHADSGLGRVHDGPRNVIVVTAAITTECAK